MRGLNDQGVLCFQSGPSLSDQLRHNGITLADHVISAVVLNQGLPTLIYSDAQNDVSLRRRTKITLNFVFSDYRI